MQITLRGRVGEHTREQQVIVLPGGEHTVDFIWREARARITGRVTGPDGAPRAELHISATNHDEAGQFHSFGATTYTDGVYELRVAPELRYTISAGLRITRTSRTNIPAGSEGIDLVVPDAGMLRVRLVDAATGEAVRTMETQLWAMSWRVSGEGEYRNEHLTSPNGVGLDGVLEIPLPVGRVDLRLNLHEDGYCLAERLGLLVDPEGREEPVEFRLERGVEVELHLAQGPEGPFADLGAHLFFLLDADQPDAVTGPYPKQGPPSNHRINSFNVHLRDQALLTRLVTIDDKGVGAVEGIPRGRYVLRAIPSDLAFDPASFEVSSNERTVVELALRAK